MSQHNISTVAHLIAEPVRAVILITLADNCARAASALAEVAGVTAQTASSHLAKLLDGGLLKVEAKGRHRYYTLAGPHVARVLESLASVGPVSQAWRTAPNSSARELRFARCCYDHLAGQIGVAVTRGMIEHAYLVQRDEYAYELTPRGKSWLQKLGADASEPFADRVEHANRCLDWTERQYHIAGALGAYLMNVFRSNGWMTRFHKTRALTVTPAGWEALRQQLGIERNDELDAQAKFDTLPLTKYRDTA
ncbi:ArsR/SmtB family transcription factor [Paraburkholderia strydomiana]|uniref:ArsR/SmtB family transcription factor n=1 Tax=Paraburkholderia strydomiana TaxID=1245417 RepID=UPI00285A48D6|nr:winged helix-turn-helix domain-containing protein [Paraburkholderia strydomiana]MDR7006624.1 DNA-binding transcriptional ArsR family regulator [Paraburkholderia strydomiana]